MSCSLQEMVNRLLEMGEPVALPLLALAAAVEYLFPPFPGDTVVLAGAVLTRLGGWSLPALVFSLLAGNLVGVTIDYLVGRQTMAFLRRREARRGGVPRPGLERIMAGYRRFGPAFLVSNRFLPGIRALFFVAAGAAGIGLGPVLIYAGLSALAWTGLLVAAGWVIGNNLGLLQELFAAWFELVWILLAGALAAFLWQQWRRRREGNS